MKIHHKKMSGTAFPGRLKTCLSLIASCSMLVFCAVAAEAAEIGGDSTTILRLRESPQEKNLFPLYEYLHLSGSSAGADGTTSIYLGAWARGDLADDSTRQNNNGDLQYGFLNYHANRSNMVVNAGRQFVSEGVASEKLDGIYLRSDLAGGFTAAAFGGSPVETETNDILEQGSFIYGGRVAHSYANLYTVGVSALKENNGGDHLREEEGLDLWLHPVQQIDITGRSSYNSLSDGWMEHAYTASFVPLDKLRVSGTLDQVRYRNYFDHVTTSALSLTNGILDPNETDMALGGTVGFTPVDNLTISGDYKHHHYDIAGNANYYGGGISFAPITSLLTGATYHRMNGASDRFRYDQYHAYATQKFGRTDLTLDFFDVDFENSINGVKNTYSFSAAVGYDFPLNVRVAADIDYSRTIDFTNDVRGLIKVVYAFGSEGRAK